MQNHQPRALLPAVVSAVLTLVAVVISMGAAEFAYKETTRSEYNLDEAWMQWTLGGMLPLGRTGLIDDGNNFDPNPLIGFGAGLVVLAVVVLFVAWLGSRASANRFGVLLVTWFSVALGAGLAAMASFLVSALSGNRADMETDFLSMLLRQALLGGYYWGMFVGFFVGLVAMLVWKPTRPTSYADTAGPWSPEGPESARSTESHWPAGSTPAPGTSPTGTTDRVDLNGDGQEPGPGDSSYPPQR